MAKKLKVKADLKAVNSFFAESAKEAANIVAKGIKYPTIESFKEAAERVLGIPLVIRPLRANSYYLDIVTPTGILVMSIYVSCYDDKGYSYGGTAGPYQELSIEMRKLTGDNL